MTQGTQPVSDLPPQIETLAATPDILNAMLGSMTAEQLAWKPSTERWSICEILAHLDHVEHHNVGLRVRRIVAEELPLLVDYDQNAEYTRGTYSGQDGHQMLEAFCQTREQSLAFLADLPAEAWSRTGRHPGVGEIRISHLLNLWAFHDLSHIRQIAELKKAICFWAGVGPLQHYYSVSP